jgi:tRNA threonylcarbamoyladenosine biosynthesis protein TsaB
MIVVFLVLTLALDTTTRAGSVAIADDDRVLAARAGDAARTHGERLPGEIDAVLVEAGIERGAIDLLVVASGPGAFTGLRIGLAAMQGLAMTLDRPIVGVSALDALAWTVLGEQFQAPLSARPSAGALATWIDAQRGEIFSGLYRGVPAGDPPWIVESEPAVGSPEAIIANGRFDRDMSTLFIGDGARRYADTITGASSRWTVSLHEPLLAPALAWIGRRLAAGGHQTSPHALQPLYVRRPDAEIERDRLVRRPVRHSPSGEDAKGDGGS